MEILFDKLTADEITARLAENDQLRHLIHVNETAINTIMVTVARMDGCNPMDTIRLNESRTGIIVLPAVEEVDQPIHKARNLYSEAKNDAE